MKKLFILISIVLTTNLFAQVRPVNTYSIVAYDSAAGEMGVAVQSHWFQVGAVVSWAEAGAGVVATQSFVDVSYGPIGLDLMRSGKTAQQALDALLSVDKEAHVRQVAMIDVHGNVAVHTGDKCIYAAGNHKGASYSTQANMMEKETVWPAMAKAYEETKGDLLTRLNAALHAAQAEGGDIRGKQSMAMLIVPIKSDGRHPAVQRIVDLRVDDHPEPLKEMDRLITINRAYAHMNKGDEYMAVNKIPEAIDEYAAAYKIYPGNIEILYWTAATLAADGRVEESLPMFKEVFEKAPVWKELTKRLPASGLLPDDKALMDKILKAAE